MTAKGMFRGAIFDIKRNLMAFGRDMKARCNRVNSDFEIQAFCPKKSAQSPEFFM